MNLFKDIDVSDFIKHFPNHSFIVSIYSPRRPGVLLFIRKLELRFYPPHITEQNDKFQLIIYGKEVKFLCIAIPTEDIDKPFIKKLCDECNIILKHGIPILFDGSGIPKNTIFPDERTYTFENPPNHPIYKLQLEYSFAEEDRLFELEEKIYLDKYNFT